MTEELIKKQLKLYHYNSRTGEFIQEGWAEFDPEVPGGSLIPQNCVLTAPPDPPPGFKSVWDGWQWIVIEDHRGEIWYRPDGSSVTVNELGPIPDNFTKQPPLSPVPTSITRKQAARWLLRKRLIKPTELNPMITQATMPQSLTAKLSSDESRRTLQELDFTEETYSRNNEELLAIFLSQQFTQEEADQFFREAVL